MHHDQPRLLIVEDSDAERERLARIASKPPSSWTERTGVRAFRVDEAANAEEARQLLGRANQQSWAYEVLLLDLSLPATKEDAAAHRENVKHGQSLLREFAQPETSVVILTAYPEADNVIQALRGGAADFMKKPLQTRDDEEELVVRLIQAVGRSREIVGRKLAYERSLRLWNQDRKQARDQLSQAVSGMASQISECVTDMAKELARTYGLNVRTDMQDPICKQLVAIKETADRMVAAAWKPYGEGDEADFCLVDVKPILDEETKRARPSYYRKEVTLEVECGAGLETRTVEQDLRTMIAELALGILDAAAVGSNVAFRAEKNADETDIAVTATYSGAPVSEDVVAQLTSDTARAGELKEHERSLIFVGRLARNIGIRVHVEDQGEMHAVRLVIPIVKT